MAHELRVNPYLLILGAFVGAALTYFGLVNDMDIVFTEGLGSNILLITLAAFVLSMMFFGYLTIPLMLLFGMAMGPTIQQQPALAMQVIPLLLAGYAGGLAGVYIQNDMNKLFSFYLKKTEVVGYFVAALLLAIVIGVIGTFLPA